jgi:uncharacterized membrane protein
MDQTHIHLLITHLPIFGSILGALVLIHGIGVRSNQTIIAAYYLFVLSALGAGIAYLTGEAAEETVEKIKGVVEATIKTHEEVALYALISLIILGVASLAGLFLTWRNSAPTKTLAFVILFISVISFGLVARTGYLGGQIRHTELSNGATAPTENSETETDN